MAAHIVKRMSSFSIFHLLQRQPAYRLALSMSFALGLLRVLDVFVIRSDEIFGEQVLTKVMGLALLIAYAWAVKGSLGGLGLHANHWIAAAGLGALIMSLALALGYAAEWLFLSATGAQPVFYLAAEGNCLLPDQAAAGGVSFALILITGNVFNAFMEEGLFRGLLISHLGVQMRLAKANLIQAVLCGAWHIVWPLRDYLDGKTDISTLIGVSLGYILLSGLIGFAWGYFYIKTNSLWASWSAHLLNNSVLNLLHITTAAGPPATLGLRVGLATLIVVVLLPWVKGITRAWQDAGFKNWAGQISE